MKKLYSTIGAVALFATMSVAQNGRVAGGQLPHAQPAVGQTGKVIQNQSPTAAGDTVWVFDGFYSYDWNGTLPMTYSVGIEDIDGLTHNSAVTTYFGTTGSYKIFYDQDPAAVTLHYGHADTVFYPMACSWFATAGQADNWIEFGPIHVPTAGGTLMWLHNYLDPNFRDGYQIKINTTGLASTNYTAAAVFSVTDNDASTAGDTANTPVKVWYPRQVSVSAFAGQDIYIGVRHYAFDMFVHSFTNMMLIEAASTGVKENKDFVIGTNMPNPAVGSTTITYTLHKSSNVSFSVTDLMGKVVYSQNLGNQSNGGHHINLSTSSFASGMYLYNFDVDGQKYSRKFVVNN